VFPSEIAISGVRPASWSQQPDRKSKIHLPSTVQRSVPKRRSYCAFTSSKLISNATRSAFT
jgi:hypothetical protein